MPEIDRRRLRLRRRARQLRAAAPARVPGRCSTRLGVSLERDEYYQRYLGFDDAGAFRTIGEAHGQAWSTPGRSRRSSRARAIVFDEILESADVHVSRRPPAASSGSRPGSRSASPRARCATRSSRILRGAGLDRHFRFIVAAGRNAGRQAGARSVSARRASCTAWPPAACVAIEDSRWGIESAKAAGLRCVGITTSYPASELPAADAIIAIAWTGSPWR